MSNELGKYLRYRRGTMSLRKFASMCNISHTHLDSIEKGIDYRSKKPVSISTETLRLIADGIGVDYVFLACLADGYDPRRVTNAIIPVDYLSQINEANLQLFDANDSSTPAVPDFDSFAYAMQNESSHLTEKDKELLLDLAKQLHAARGKEGVE